MAKGKQGGVFGFLRGKVGSVTYSVLAAEKSSSGKKEQVVRALPESVSNPQTAGQVMQRMKLAPAQKFYSAFSELLSNAFQGVSYGDASRRHFMALALKQEGPYVQKGVDRFIPAAYSFSQGSLPSVGIEPFAGGASVITLANTVAEGVTTITNAAFAELLGVGTDYQITVAVVNNVNGVFIPSYIPFDNRLKIANLPEGTLAIANGHVTISPAALGLDASAMVACCVVLSVQDASGNWLRSNQDMVISNELRSSLYGPDALEAAIYSYQNTTTANSVNSAWYYNLGLSQAWGGKLITITMDLEQNGQLDDKAVIMGIQQIDGRVIRTVFATATTDDGLIVYVEGGRVTTNSLGTVSEFKTLHMGEYNNIEQWQEGYAAQLGLYSGGSATPAPVSELYWRSLTANNDGGTSVTRKCIVTADGKLLKVHDHNGNNYYFFGAHEDSTGIYWTIGNSATEVANFSEAAGGATQVDGEVAEGTTTFTYNNVEYYFDASKFTPDVVGELKFRKAYYRQIGTTPRVKLAVNEQGQLITTSENFENCGLCFDNNSDENSYWNTTNDGGGNVGLTEELWATILSDWGVEIITELSDSSSSRGFVLPAKDDMAAQAYAITEGVIDPNLTVYSA